MFSEYNSSSCNEHKFCFTVAQYSDRAVTKSGTGTWDLGREDVVLGDAGRWDSRTRGRGTRGRREVGRGDTGTRGRQESGTAARGDAET